MCMNIEIILIVEQLTRLYNRKKTALRSVILFNLEQILTFRFQEPESLQVAVSVAL